MAERRLLRSLVKDTDGLMARHFDRHISLQISRRLAIATISVAGPLACASDLCAMAGRGPLATRRDQAARRM